MRFLTVLLVLPLAAAHGEDSSCRELRPAARKLEVSFPPSTQNVKNCAQIGDMPSNYIIATDPDAPLEMHVISVEEGSLPVHITQDDKMGPERAVRVIVYKTEMPAMIFLNANKSVRWNLTVTKEADVDRIVVQGVGEQQVRGVPDGIPVIYRPREKVCARAYGWENKYNRHGADYRMLITSIRCSTGLRESSFQACSSGAIFEVPHYRIEDNLKKVEDWSPPCPLPVEPDVISPAIAYRYKNRPEHSGPKLPSPRPIPKRRPRRAETGPPPGDAQELNLPPADPYSAHQAKTSLPAAKAPPARRDIPVRALAILLEGRSSLATHDAIPDLIVALERGDASLRSRAADELGKMGKAAEPALKPLIRALRKDENLRVRASAALALGNLGQAAPDAVRYLKKALHSDDANLRLSAETALERIDTKRARIILKRYRGR